MDTKKITLMLPAFIVLALLLFSCSFVNPLEDFQIMLNAPPMSTVVTIQFQDGATGETIMRQAVDVTVVGEDADKIADFGFEAETHFNAVAGITSFSLLEDVEPTPEDPINIKLLIRSEGFIPTSMPLNITQHGNYPYTVKLTCIANPPRGVSLKTSKAGNCTNQGVVRESISVQTETTGDMPTKASVTLQQGTQLLNSAGRPLRGEITTMIAYFNPMDQEALDVFPGGMSGTVTTLEGEEEDVIFSTAGFLELQITDSLGRSASTLEGGGLDVNIEISPNLTNPETGEPVQPGDTIPVWSYDDATGQWTEEGITTISGPNNNGFLVSTFTATHLSSYNLDWKLPNCDFYIGFRNWNGEPVLLCFYMEGTSLARFYVHDELNYFMRFPANTDLHIIAYQENLIVADSTIHTPYPNYQPPTFWLNLSSDPDGSGDSTGWVDPYGIFNGGGNRIVEFLANLSCFDEGEDSPYATLRPNLPVYVRPPNLQSWYYVGVMQNGRFQFSTMRSNSTYIFQFNHQQVDPIFLTVKSGEFEYQDVVYDLRLTREFCDGTDEHENRNMYGAFNLQSRYINNQETSITPLRYQFDQGGYGTWYSPNDSNGLTWYTGGRNLFIVQMPIQSFLGTYTLVEGILTFRYDDIDGRQVIETFIKE